MPFKKKAAQPAAADAPTYVLPKIAFVATAHHHFVLLGGASYDSDEHGFVWDVPPEHYGAMLTAGAVPIICNYDEVMDSLPGDDHDDDDDDDTTAAVHTPAAHKFPSPSGEKK